MKWTDQENKIRDRLSQREISPSGGAWDKLEAHLEDKQKTTHKKNWWWGIAASLVIGVGIATFFYTQSPSTFLNAVTKDSVKPTDSLEEETDFDSPTEIAVDPLAVEKAESDLDFTKKTTENNQTLKSKVDKGALAQSDSMENKSITQKEIPREKSETTELLVEKEAEKEPKNTHDDWNEAVAGVLEKAKEKEQTGTVSDEEIDQLIHEAQLRYKAESALKASENTVDANLLLQEVELEMDQPLKERIFKAIKEQWEKAKTAVASNNQ